MKLLSAEASKMESWSSGTIPNVPHFKGICLHMRENTAFELILY